MRTTLPTLLLTSALLCAAMAQGAPLTLEALQARAQENDLRVLEASAELARLRAQYREASWAWFPKFESTAAVAGPTPEARNDGLGGPPTTPATLMYDLDFGDPGVMVRAEMNAFLPLFTFGKLDALETAAARGVEVGEGLRERAQAEAVYQAAQAFYGYQFARQGRAALTETMERLNTAQELIEELLRQESPQVTRIDLYKVQYFKRQVEARLGQADAGRQIALTAVRLLVGAQPGETIEVVEQDLEAAEATLHPFSHYEKLAAEHRPELRAVRAGIAAREQEVIIRQRLFLPDFGLVGFFRWMYTSSATRQLSPFAYDPYNDLSGGVAFVARATFDFPIKDAQLEQARAEVAKLQAQAGQIRAGITLEVRQAYSQLQAALSRAKALDDAERNARRWATAAFASFELGTSDTRELTDAFSALAVASAEKIQARHDAHLGLEALSRVIGTNVREAPAAGQGRTQAHLVMP